jgi:hypothetical protein
MDFHASPFMMGKRKTAASGLAAALAGLAGGDVHGDFETETQVAGLRGGPGHGLSP